MHYALILQGKVPSEIRNTKAVYNDRARSLKFSLLLKVVNTTLETSKKTANMEGMNHIRFSSHSTGALVLEHHSPADVAKAIIESGCQKEPFYVFDMDEAYRRIQHFKRVMPRVQIFYAMKSNDSDMMLKLAVASDIGFDCASTGEIYKLRQLSVNPQNILYAMTTKTSEQMAYARDTGIYHTTFDSSLELTKIREYWPDARLLIRIRVDGESVYKLGDKFGCDYETEAIPLLEEAAALNLKVVGVAFHVGSACKSIDSHSTGLKWAKSLFDHETRAGRKMTIVDIGGGFISDRTDRIDKVASEINGALECYFPDKEVQVIAEPGRYICDSAFTLYSSINSIRQARKGDDVVTMIYMNDGTFGTLRYTEAWHTVERFRPRADGETDEKVILWGPTCHSSDRIMQNELINLPKCTLRDWLVFPKQGAYTAAFASQFSCLPKPLIRSVISLNLWNTLKHFKVFKATDFVVDPDIAAPLPSTMPRLISHHMNDYEAYSPILKV